MKIVCKDCGTEFELKESEIGFYKSKGLEIPKRCKSCRDKKKSSSASATGTKQIAGSNVGYVPGSGRVINTGGNAGNKNLLYAIIAIAVIVLIIGGIFIARNMLTGDGDNNLLGDNEAVTNTVTVVDGVDADDTETFVDAEDITDIDNSDIENTDTEGTDTEDTETVVNDGTDNNADASDNTETTVNDSEPEIQETVTEEPEIVPVEQETVPDEPEIMPEEQETVPAQVDYVFRNSYFLNQHYEKHGIEMGFDSAESYQAAASAVINNPNALHKVEAEDGDYCYYIEDTNEFVVLSLDGYIRTYFLPSGGKAYYDRQ